jgi:hypothetical protein
MTDPTSTLEQPKQEITQVDWDKFKCRCSAISKIMADSRSNPCITEKQKLRLIELEAKQSPTEPMKKEIAELLVKQENSTKVILSDTAIEYLMEVYAWETEGMVAVDRELSYIPQLEKGKEAEEESITMLSRFEKVLYKKHKGRISNDFLSGEPDVFEGDDIMTTSTIIDMKNAWDYVVFLKFINKVLENGYKDQVGGYCDITKAKKGKIVRALVSMSAKQQYDQAERLVRKLGCATMESPEFLEYWPQLEKSMNFGHIPIRKRLFIQDVEPFTAERKQMIYDRVKVCREWLWKFDEMYTTINT